ncbi:valine--tRNA ligase [archaeon BMS3Bbin15]|nr:valine--tRNA ligase [archaeon BMS3Bbin15]
MLDGSYNPEEIEKKWHVKWEEMDICRFDRNSNKPVFSIDTPPPTVSGKMHLGHAFSYSQMDFMARYMRMRGFNVFYPFGTDDNGLPTERLVEKLNNVNATEMPREEFVKLCLSTLEKILPEFVQNWKNIGISADFSLYYSTIDEHCRRISQRSFIDLYRAGVEYRKESPFIWCPNCQTAIAQVELEDKEMKSSFNDIIFKVEDENLIISTTRPELLPACVAVFVHPEDKRYSKYVGRKARVPVFNHEVEILADSRVDPEKGSGMVMCCTFGDTTDIEWYMEYNLPLKVAITKDGRMTSLTGKYEGMTIKEARQKIIEDLREAGLLVGSKEITHIVNVHERCRTEIEILNTKQWFIKYLDKKEKFKELGREMNWYPGHMRHRYDNWIDGLKWDWCISRQRFSGVPFPVWYCRDCGEIKLAELADLPVDPLSNHPSSPCKCGSTNFEPEKDVLDTWATSSLTLDIAIELIEDEDMRKKLYPMSMRPQAHDIITFWLFNTVVKAYFHHNNIPWKDIMISGWALDPQGKKMSKSKGNVIEPQIVIEKYSADALRLWASGNKLGEDLSFQEKDLVTAQRFLTKLWNASKFALMHLKDYNGDKPEMFNFIDLWVLSKCYRTVKQATDYFEEYKYSKVRKAVTEFFLKDFCDSYLEMVKYRIYSSENSDEKTSALYTLYTVLLTSLKLLAPFIPHITEEIYHAYFALGEPQKSINIDTWPEVRQDFVNHDVERDAEIAVKLTGELRRFKAERRLALNHPIKRVVISCPEHLKDILTKAEKDIAGTLVIQKLKITTEPLKIEERITEIVPDFSVLGPEFKGDAKMIVSYLKGCDAEAFARELLDKGEISIEVEGKKFTLEKKHIKEVKKEIKGEGKVLNSAIAGLNVLVEI